MEQEKIGKFIAKIRKEKKLTQKNLADSLGITDRAISKWENGKSMPDLSLLKPLCDILDVSINELLSGENISKDEKESNLENNIVNAINYSKKKQNYYEMIFYGFILVLGVLMFIMSMSICSATNVFMLEYSIIGTYILMTIFNFLLKNIIMNNKDGKYLVGLIIGFFVLYFSYLWVIDFINVKMNNGYPDIFVISGSVTDKHFSYDTLFYDLYICNVNKDYEYRKIVFDIDHTASINKFDKYCNK